MYDLDFVIIFQQKRIRSEENKKRRLENERKAEIVQPVNIFISFYYFNALITIIN